MKRLGVFLLPLDGTLVHRRSFPRNLLAFPQQFTGTHLYTWAERGIVRVKCLAQKHNTMSPVRAWTRTARSENERTNHEATEALLEINIDIKIHLNEKTLGKVNFNLKQPWNLQFGTFPLLIPFSTPQSFLVIKGQLRKNVFSPY